jgi:prepilin-type processing-associated H-X9-DG protein
MIGESGARQEGWSQGRRYNDGTTWGMRGAWGAGSNNIVCAGTVGPIVPPTGNSSPTKVTTAAQVNGAISINGQNQGELYSFHSGGCNVAMGDGSVRNLRDSTPFNIIQLLSARADGIPFTLN